MDPEKSPAPNAPKGKHDLTSRRAFLLALYIFVLVILVKLYWPGWPFPNNATAPVTPTPAPTSPVPQN